MKRSRTRRSGAARRRRKARDHDGADRDTERRILDAAHAVFLRRGTAGARMQEIAREAGVNQALLHYYFRTKDRLSQAAFERAASEFMPAVIRVLASPAGLEEKIARVVQIEIDHLSRVPYLPAYLISEITHRPERTVQFIAAATGRAPDAFRPQVLEALRSQIAARVQAGTMRPIAPEQFIVNLLSLCVFPFAARPMICAMLDFDRKDFDRFLARRRRELPGFFLGALRP